MPTMHSARCSSRSTGVGREREADAGSVREVGTLKMIDYNVGVSTVATYELKKIDTDYFTEE